MQSSQCALRGWSDKNITQCGVDLIRTQSDAAFIWCGHRGPERGVAREIDQKISGRDENVRGLSRNRQNPRCTQPKYSYTPWCAIAGQNDITFVRVLLISIKSIFNVLKMISTIKKEFYSQYRYIVCVHFECNRKGMACIWPI